MTRLDEQIKKEVRKVTRLNEGNFNDFYLEWSRLFDKMITFIDNNKKNLNKTNYYSDKLNKEVNYDEIIDYLYNADDSARNFAKFIKKTDKLK